MTSAIISAKSSPAFARSAEFYDEIYRDRGPIYDRDCLRVANLFQEHSQGNACVSWPRKPQLIDWGAGTGEHIRRWEASGWSVVGIDSSLAMVRIAKEKGSHVFLGSICDPAPRAHSQRDLFAVQACLFASFSYATTGDEQLDAALKSVHRRSRMGGLFIFDVINHSAAASHLRDSRNSDRAIDTGRVWRSMRKTFDIETSIITAEMSYQVGGPAGECFSETHKLRAYTPREISAALARHGFDVLRMFDPESEQIEGGPIRADSYYFMVVARVR